MIRNYFITAWRNLVRNKTFSAINITGLALGITCSLLILFWVQDEYRIDAFHANRDRLHSIYQREFAEGEVGAGYYTSGLLADELKKQMPEVELAANYRYDYSLFAAGDKKLKEKGLSAGQDFFALFSFPLLQGQRAAALQTPASIAISKKMAIALFGSPAAAMGKTLRYSNSHDFSVTAVFDDVPAHSSLQFDYVVSWQFMLNRDPELKNWGSNNSMVAVLLRKNADPALFRSKIRRFLDKYYTNQGPGLREELDMQLFAHQYLHRDFRNGQVSGGRIGFVRLFSLVAVFILLIACINFMNLTTARSVKRAKEIGVRKVVGALRSALVQQFIGETLLLVFFAIAIGLLLAYMLLPLFNELTGKQIVVPSTQPLFWLQLLGLGMVTGFVAGSYPALYLSSFQPVRVLKGVLRFSKSAVGFRKGLVVFQFVLSIVLIIGTIVVSKQIHYVQTLNLGYNRENLLYIPIEGELGSRYNLFKQEAMKLPGVKLVSQMTGSPTQIGHYEDDIRWEGRDPNFRPTFAVAAVGYDFTQTMGVQLLQGRDFSPAFPTDSLGFLVNESAAKKMGYANPIGHRITDESGKTGTIIGLIRDVHFSSLREEIAPLLLGFGNQSWGNILVRTAAGKTPEVLAALERLCKQLNPQYPFSYSFADEEYQHLYQSEQMVGRLSTCFAVLAIVISCMGLLGLALFTAQQRTKEIGVRKVLGASVLRLFTLLSKEFLLLVFIAFVIAAPLAWWGMHLLLEDYAYRTSLSWWIFALAGALALLIALATVSFQAMRAAMVNPVRSLRTE